MNCPECGNVVIFFKSGKAKVRTNILIFEKGENGDFSNGGVICNKCKTFVNLPIQLNLKEEVKLFIVNNEKKDFKENLKKR